MTSISGARRPLQPADAAALAAAARAGLGPLGPAVAVRAALVRARLALRAGGTVRTEL
ncbi:MAG: hypothetical protein INR63_20095, partial [Actinomycetospora chiangmaiensis]|nr:hypothetical protein [Actinomycetospora chiangmaiensis]